VFFGEGDSSRQESLRPTAIGSLKEVTIEIGVSLPAAPTQESGSREVHYPLEPNEDEVGRNCKHYSRASMNPGPEMFRVSEGEGSLRHAPSSQRLCGFSAVVPTPGQSGRPKLVDWWEGPGNGAAGKASCAPSSGGTGG